MNEIRKERMLELLADDAILGLSDEERTELEKLQQDFPDFKNDDSFKAAAAAINLTNLDTDEQMPQHLEAKILANAAKFFDSDQESESPIPITEESPISTVSFEETKRRSWLGWAFAVAASIALVVNIGITRFSETDIAKGPGPIQTPSPEPSDREMRNQLLTENKVIKADWSSVQADIEVSGDVVWSDAKQKGYMRFQGLPLNDKQKETYQLWIFDETQDEKTPIDGGVFDIGKEGEVIVPINAKLNVQNPKLFAVTVEKPGGVVVSKQEKIITLGKVSQAAF